MIQYYFILLKDFFEGIVIMNKRLQRGAPLNSIGVAKISGGGTIYYSI